jgi:MoxR-like ATPase
MSPDHELPLEPTLYQVKKTIVGQDGLLERMLVALLARGHLLVEGVPGLAKTMAVKTLAQSIGGDFQRIQFTSDLVPADVVGTRIYNQREGEFQVSFGPVFTNLLLADEINRAPAKVQSALLEVMQERQVTIGRETYPAPDPFLVMATQNPIESEGTYPLPEAQLDRFMFKVLVGYPTATQEYVVVERMISTSERPEAVIDTATLREYQRAADAVYVDPQIIEYAVKIAAATRDLAGAGHPELARLRRRSAPAPARRSTWCSGRRRWRSCAAATTPCPATRRSWPRTCCGTGSCCPTRRSPTTSPPTHCSTPLLQSIAVPKVEPGVRAHKS